MSDPLEQFLIEYVDAAGGLAEEVEPQVYDVLLPNADRTLRVAFDPEALPEHPHAQLVTFGSALLDQLLEQAQARGHLALVYLDDVHVAPHALEGRVRRDFTLPPGMSLQMEAARPLYVTTTVFWFETTFVSDEKEQSLYPIAVDRYHGRLVRHLELLLTSDRLAEIRRYPYPDVRSLPLDQAYQQAGERVARTVTAEANSRKQDLLAYQAQQRERMTRYFADLRSELSERVDKAQARGEETDSLRARREALDREEALRLEELRRKTMLRVHVQLTNLLHIKTPRLFLNARLALDDAKPFAPYAPAGAVQGAKGKRTPIPLTLTWDPLVEKSDALDCPNCRHPTYELRLGSLGELRCGNCYPG